MKTKNRIILMFFVIAIIAIMAFVGGVVVSRRMVRYSFAERYNVPSPDGVYHARISFGTVTYGPFFQKPVGLISVERASQDGSSRILFNAKLDNWKRSSIDAADHFIRWSQDSSNATFFVTTKPITVHLDKKHPTVRGFQCPFTGTESIVLD